MLGKRGVRRGVRNTCMPLNYSASFYYLFRLLIWLIWLVAPLLGLLVCLSKYQSCSHVCRCGGCFSIKKHGKRPHPLGSAGSQIKSALYTPTAPQTAAPLFTYLFIFLLTTKESTNHFIVFCLPKRLSEQPHAAARDKWGQAHCNFHINHGLWRAGGWGGFKLGGKEGQRDRGNREKISTGLNWRFGCTKRIHSSYYRRGSVSCRGAGNAPCGGEPTADRRLTDGRTGWVTDRL